MADECSVENPVEVRACSVTCIKDYTKDGDTTTTKTTWTCSVHEPPDRCVIGELNTVRRKALQEAADVILKLKA